MSVESAAKSKMDSQSALADENWLFAVCRIAAHYRIAVSPETMRLNIAWKGKQSVLRRLCRTAGLRVEEVALKTGAISGMRLPLLAEFKNGEIGVIEAETNEGFRIAFGADQGLHTVLRASALLKELENLYVLRPAANVADRRIDDYIAPWRPDWLRSIVLSDLKPYAAVLLASCVTNVLALAGIIFSMQVYDRVVPGQSLETLHVLFGGVVVAILFGFLMKISRNRITDAAAREADLRVSDKVFGHALRVRNTARPRATGTFIAQIRELEHVREIMASTTITAVADLPFFFMFCLLFFYIAGGLVWIPLTAMVLLILPGLLAQRRLRQLAEASSRENSLRGAMLVEAVQGLDDIKSLQAEGQFQNLWNHYTEVTSGASMQLRDLVNRLSSWAQTVQGGVFAVVVFFGAPLAMEGEMSTGVLVAASMLSSRMLAPLASVTQIINRWQQARVAREALDVLLALPVDTPEGERRIHKPIIEGHYEAKNAVFGYNPEAPVLSVSKLEIKPGERIAILGRNGAGKSTLLSALSGLLEPLDGSLKVDGLTIGLIDPADLRRDIGYMGQNARLFHGTLRENLALGAPMASDEEMISTLDKLGLGGFVEKLPDGLDHMVQEGGLGLSGGQRQGLLLTRLMLRHPRVLLLDEPTATLDEVAENNVIKTLGEIDKDMTLIIATHRPAVLSIIDRFIVVSDGAVVRDGPKAEVIASLKTKAGKSAA